MMPIVQVEMDVDARQVLDQMTDAQLRDYYRFRKIGLTEGTAALLQIPPLLYKYLTGNLSLSKSLEVEELFARLPA